MSRTEYYTEMKALARSTRAEYGITTPRVMKEDIRRIYRKHGIQLHYWDHKLKKLRGAYFNDDLGATVMIVKGLPYDPTIFTLAHELKHHLADRHLPIACCENNPRSEMIEIGAEIFAAEFIFPEQEFADMLTAKGITAGTCTPEVIVRLKRETQTTLSYSGLAKRAEFMKFAPDGSLGKVKWIKLEEEIFGEPAYKRINRYRQSRK